MPGPVYIGVFLSTVIGLGATYLSHTHPVLDSLVLGLISGMLLRTLIAPFIGAHMKDAILRASRFLVILGIVFYGVNLRLDQLNSISITIWVQILIGLIVVFWVAYWLGNKLGLPLGLISLLSAGTAVCGASAIAIATPVVNGKPEDSSAALIATTACGLLCMLIYPPLSDIIFMSSDSYALLCATTLPQTGMVRSASAHLGPGCVDLAMLFKVARTTMIVPVVIFLISLHGDPQSSSPGGVLRRVPWYLWGFLASGLLFSFIAPLQFFNELIKPCGQFIWVVAMSGIGLSVDIRDSLKGFWRAILLSFVLWMLLFANFFIGYYGLNY